MLGNQNHERTWIHMKRPVCPEGAACQAYQKPHYEDHLDIYEHPPLPMFRPMCRHLTACQQQLDREHVKRESHPMPGHFPSAKYMATILSDTCGRRR